ncbi:MAG: BatD family protein [Prevotella sp.]|nr:BatD family protein [Prevotella sp.]
MTYIYNKVYGRARGLLMLLALSPLAALAQSLTGRAPQQVAVGEQFRLSYTVNTDDAKGFRAGQIPDAFEVLMGPSTSTQSSFQMVNGHMSSSASITYTYILSATKNGSFTIPAAHVTVDGKTVTSNELHIKVSGQAQSGQQGGHQQQQQSGNGEVRAAGTAISGSDLFIKVSASKQHVREQEAILLTYKVYTLVGLTQLNGKMADLKSFYTREVPLPQEKQFHIETLNGRPYRTVTWQQYVMFPQATGKLEVPSLTYEGIVVQQNRNIDPFEAFFNGGSGYVEVKKQIKAPGITIQVDPLPQRPANFSGGVGRFSISATLDKTDVKANDPVKLHVVVSGVGNMKLLKQPEVQFPKDFDHYDAKVTDRTKLTTQGLEGQMVYDFLAVPRHQGTFEIPPIEYTYFDTQANQYKTVRTEAFTLNVAKGDGGTTATYTGQEDVKQLNSDIRYIKTGATRQKAVGDFFFGSTEYWAALMVLLLGFVSLFVIFRQRAIENANVVKQRAGKANKVATKRLKRAAKLMAAGQQSEFYDEVLRALWGYVGDKLSMPVEQLSRENISQQLSAHNVTEETVRQFIGALDECEFARYAPGDATGNMNKVYDAAMTAITTIATAMRKGKVEWKVKSILLFYLFTFLPLTTFAVTKAEADSAYAKEQYQQAARDYEALLRQGVSAELYYNLGNCYYRMDQITQAVLSYERALLLSPGDRDIRFNLQMARSKTIDKITPESEMFFVTWYRSLVNLQSVDAWARLALIALVVAIVLALVYLFSDRIWLRKVGFFGGIALLLVFVLSNLFAWQQKRGLDHRTGAVIVRSAVNVKSTPSQNGTDLFILHEGTRVTITDDSMRGWKQVRVADGKEGWLETKEIEVI